MPDPDPKPIVPDEAPPVLPDELPDDGGDVDFPGETPPETPPLYSAQRTAMLAARSNAD